MRIAVISGFASYWQRYPVNVLDLEEGMSLGGGEEAMLQTTVGLAALGHEVHAYHYGDGGVWRGVQFYSNGELMYPKLAGEHWDAIVGWNAVRPLMYVEPSTRKLLDIQLNDLAIPGAWSSVDCVLSPSADHSRMVWGWGWRGPRAVVHNGLEPWLYRKTERRVPGAEACRQLEAQGWKHGGNQDGAFVLHRGTNPTPWKERPLHVGYWSSPDRGLHHVLRAWPLVKKMEPKARLFVAYEIKRYLEMALRSHIGFYSARAREIAYLMAEAEHDQSITFTGMIPRRKLAKVQRECRVMFYPFDVFGYCEGFCGAVNIGISAGCLVMTTPKDALPSLYDDSCYWFKKSPSDLDFYEHAAEEVVKGLHGELPEQEKILSHASINAERYTWERASRELEAACKAEGWRHGPP